MTDTVTVNGRILTSTYEYDADTDTRTWTDLSPEGRQTVTFVDNLGRVTDIQVTGLDSYSLSYDSHGRIEQAAVEEL